MPDNLPASPIAGPAGESSTRDAECRRKIVCNGIVISRRSTRTGR